MEDENASRVENQADSEADIARVVVCSEQNHNTATDDYVPLPADIWGVFILELVTDFAEMFDGMISVARVTRMTFVAIAAGINFWLQFVILHYINYFIVGKALHDVQSNYAHYHRDVFHADGSFDEQRWKAWEGAPLKLCSMAVDGDAVFSICIVFVWSGRMLGELRAIERFFRNVVKIGALPPGKKVSDMVEEIVDPKTQKIEELHLRYLNCISRMFIYISVIIPKVIIAVVLLYIGCAWLAATTKKTNLILNALALEFVISIDENMYEHFAPERMKERARAFKMVNRTPTTTNPESEYQIIVAYARSLLYLVGGCLWAWAYLMHLQQVLPGFRHDVQGHCAAQEKYYQPLCYPFADAERCFPTGKGD